MYTMSFWNVYICVHYNLEIQSSTLFTVYRMGVSL